MRRHHSQKDKDGLTLIELMLATVIASIVMMTISSLLVGANRQLLQTNTMVQMHRDGELAANAITQFIQKAKLQSREIRSRNITNGIEYYYESEDSREHRIVWNQNTGQLIHQPSGVVLAGTPWNINFAITDGVVVGLYNLDLQLSDPASTRTIDYSLEVLSRNPMYDGE